MAQLSTYATFVGSRICMQKDLGLNGNLFGGNMLAWADEMAAIFARKATGERYLVTFKFGEILFRYPVREGDLVDFYCHTRESRHSSISFDISAEIGDKMVFSTNCIFVAVDKDGNKKNIDWDKLNKKERE